MSDSQQLTLQVHIPAPVEQCDQVIADAIKEEGLSFRSESTRDDNRDRLIARTIALNSSLGEWYGHVAVIEIVREFDSETELFFTEQVREAGSFRMKRAMSTGAVNNSPGDVPQQEWSAEPELLSKAIEAIRSKLKMANLWPEAE